ncbi:MAG: extracellular solute-binding protein [Defluviitaleaceae bacterium]|nr:extracellular solute-binding protein [Defluviitaleaceae bacterium]
MKKLIKVLPIMLLAGFVFAACAAPAPEPVVTPPAVVEPPPPPPVVETPGEWTPADAGNVTINFSWWGVEARAEAMEAAFDIFMARYPNVTIAGDWGPFGGHLDSLILQLATGEEPDIMQVNYAWVHSLAPDGNNVFFDINAVSDIVDLSEWTSGDLSFMNVGGELAGVPHGMNGRIVVYNRLLLEEFGLDTFPATVEELIAFGEQVSVGNNLGMDLGDNRYALANLDNLLFDLSILTWLYATTGNPLQQGGQMLHTEEQVAAIFDLVYELQATGTVQNPLQETAGFPNHNDPVWTSGRAGGALVWVSDVNNFKNTFLVEGSDHWEDLGVAPLPVPAGTSPVTMQRPSLGHAISRNTSHPEVAAYLLNFLYTDPDAIRAIGATLGVPFSRTAAEITWGEGIVSDPQIEGMEILAVAVGVIDEYFEDPRLREPRQGIFGEFRHGTIDSATAAARFVNEQQSALDTIFSE